MVFPGQLRLFCCDDILSRCLASMPSICAALSLESIWISYERNELLFLPQQHVRM
jgi:hypothetical protein